VERRRVYEPVGSGEPGSGPFPLVAMAAALLAAGLLARAGAGPEAHVALLLASTAAARYLPPSLSAALLALLAAAAPLLWSLGLAPPLSLPRHLLALLPVWAFASGALALLDARRNEVRHLRDEVQRLADAHPLTGAATRRELLRQGERLLALARRSGRPLSLLSLDVDGLAQLNGRHGSELGDEVVRTVAVRLKDALRTTDAVGRMEGGRFAVVMPDTPLEGARAAAERARGAVADDGLFAPGGNGSPERVEVRFTVSVGVTALLPDDAGAETLLLRADRALAAAKEAGRDRVATA